MFVCWLLGVWILQTMKTPLPWSLQELNRFLFTAASLFGQANAFGLGGVNSLEKEAVGNHHGLKKTQLLTPKGPNTSLESALG